MKRNLLLLASLLGLITGCASPTESSIPTPYPPDHLPTVIALTAQAIGDSATATYVASIPTDTPTFIPEPTLTFTPGPTYTPTSIPEHDLSVIEFVATDYL